MRLRFAPFAIVLLLAASAGAAEPLRIGGTGTATGMLEQIAPAFTAATGIKVVVVQSLGSSGGIRALNEYRLDIAVAARRLRASEYAGGLIEIGTLRTAFVFATSHRKPNGLKSAELAGIYKAANPTWADGTPMRIILRPRSDTDSDLLAEQFPGMRDALEAARKRPEVPTGATDQDNADLAERVKGSLTAATTTQIKTEGRHLQIVPLDSVEPTLANFESGAYPHVKRLYFIARIADGSATVRFMEFLRSPEGLKLLREAEVLPESK